MLPLDELNKSASEAFAAEGISEDRLAVALYLDFNAQDQFGETWLAISSDAKTLYRLRVDEGAIEQFALDSLKAAYVDNYATSCRLLAHKVTEDTAPEAVNEAPTVVVGSCTNACKRKLFAFLQIWERLSRGDTIANDDPIFEQFHAKCPKCGHVYEDQQKRICNHCNKRKNVVFRMLGYFKDFKLQFGTVLVCLVLTSIISLLSPIISGQLLYDQVISKPSFDAAGKQITGNLHELKYVFLVVALIVALAVISLIIQIIQSRAVARMSSRVVRNMKIDLFTALQSLSLSYFNQNNTGRLISRVDHDAVRIKNFFVDGVPHLIIHSLNFIGLSIFLFSINWKLTLVVFIPVPIIVLIFKRMLPKLWRMHSKQWRRSSGLNSMMSDSLNGVRVVKAFAKENEETSRFSKFARRLTEVNLETNLVALTIFPVVGLLIGMSSQAIWGFGGIEVMNKHMTYGELTTYLGYIGMIFGPLNFFSNFTNQFTETANSAVRMFETLDTVPEITNAKDCIPIEKIKGEIKFEHVNFHYSPSRSILKDISFTINAGDHVGVVGHTGSGKSTLASLVMRMYDVISGAIYIDGVNIKDIEIASLRRNIAIVSQEIFLFAGSIADNIRYARPEATMEEVIAAARAANAHDFIMSLPEGYQTMVGGGSRSLSGGERQRISIARALLLEPSLLILDEATAAMDTQTERLISEAIDKLIVGRTTITIAHRLSTLKNCDYIMAIENGELVEMGPQDELLEQKGVYYKLFTLQNDQLNKVKTGA